MSINTVKVPFLGTNDDECVLVDWLIQPGDSVHADQALCTVETTKATFTVQTQHGGFFYFEVHLGERLKTGALLGIISTIALNPEQAKLAIKATGEPKEQGRRATQKAIILLKQNGLSLEEFEKIVTEGPINEETVKNRLKELESIRYSRGFTALERVAVIGGVSGGGALIVIESILRTARQQAVAIFDRDKKYHGSSILGVPVAGDMTTLHQWVNEHKVDAVVIAFNRNLDERAKVFASLQQEGIKLTNVVDAQVEIRTGVKLGTGNIILGRTYLGAQTVIGDNNFISAGVHLEHGNLLGSHCGFGPGVATSGNVIIGDRVRLGTGIYVEPEVRIGNGCIISSGSVITASVPDGYILHIENRNLLKKIA